MILSFLTVNSSITYQVTAMASNFAIVTTTQEASVSADSGTIAYKLYLTLHVPPAETCPKVKMIQFECESHDQGWADDENYSYSWVDLVVTSSSGIEVYRQNRAYANAVANSNYHMHVTLYNENDEIVQKCAPGSTLELVLCAQYPAWSNTAKYGRIAIYY